MMATEPIFVFLKGVAASSGNQPLPDQGLPPPAQSTAVACPPARLQKNCFACAYTPPCAPRKLEKSNTKLCVSGVQKKGAQNEKKYAVRAFVMNAIGCAS